MQKYRNLLIAVAITATFTFLLGASYGTKPKLEAGKLEPVAAPAPHVPPHRDPPGTTIPTAYYYQFDTPTGRVDIRVSKDDCDALARGESPLPPDGYTFIGCVMKEGGMETVSSMTDAKIKRHKMNDAPNVGKMTVSDFTALKRESGKFK